jgi:hypothetical protein
MPFPPRLLAVPALAASTLLLTACFKPAEQKAAEPPPPPPEPFSTAATVAPTSTPSVAGIPAAAIAAAERAKARVEVASTATRDNGAIYKEAQTLFTEQKYAEALHALDGIQAELMTPPQEKAVAELRAQIQARLNPSAPVAAPGTPAGAVSAAANSIATPSAAPADNRALYLQAKALLAEKKYAAALQALDAMQTSTLNEAQKKAVEDLRSQIMTAGL